MTVSLRKELTRNVSELMIDHEIIVEISLAPRATLA